MAARDRRGDSARQHKGLLRLRWRMMLGLLVLVGLGLGGHLLWQQQAELISHDPRYVIHAESIRATPQPGWIRSPVLEEVLRDARLVGTLSVLDDPEELHQRIEGAFEVHPWVKQVSRVAVRLPAGIDVELEYRQPVAAVETSGQHGVALVVIDAEAVRLPDADFSAAEKRYLPRIAGVVGRPPIGAPWTDPRVVGGAKLAGQLAEVWQQLKLFEILPSPEPLVRGDARWFAYQIVTSGGTRIMWGAAPGQEPQDESPFPKKLQRLQSFISEHGPLDTIDGPASLDVRSDLVVSPRTVRLEREIQSEQTATEVAAKPSAEEENTQR